MKKLLLFISISFLFFTNVFADTLPDCLQEYKINYSIGTSTSYVYYWYPYTSEWRTVSNIPSGSGLNTIKYLIPYSVGTDIYLRFSDYNTTSLNFTGTNVGVSVYSSNQFTNGERRVVYISSIISQNIFTYSYDNTTGILHIVPISDSYTLYGESQVFAYISLWFNNANTPFTSNSGEISLTNFEPVCTPPIPPGPSSNATYDSFLDVFLDRFEFLAINFTSNPYLFAFIGIIFAWIILELFLRIFHIRGGYKK